MRLFLGETLEVANRLIGVQLVHDSPAGLSSGRIVETEAYLATDDEASHSAGGQSARNGSMFLAAGHAYVYLIYGLHRCFNVVTNREGIGEAVLIRALEPIEGLQLMASRRGLSDIRQLCNGPAKLVQAMGLSAIHDGADLTQGTLILRESQDELSSGTIVQGPRIGIRKARELPYRFALADSPWLSRPAVSAKDLPPIDTAP